jgi:hypothetical protein
VLEEIDESCFWIELLVESGLIGQQKVAKLQSEGNELCAIMMSSRKTARQNSRKCKPPDNRLDFEDPPLAIK